MWLLEVVGIRVEASEGTDAAVGIDYRRSKTYLDAVIVLIEMVR